MESSVTEFWLIARPDSDECGKQKPEGGWVEGRGSKDNEGGVGKWESHFRESSYGENKCTLNEKKWLLMSDVLQAESENLGTIKKKIELRGCASWEAQHKQEKDGSVWKDNLSRPKLGPYIHCVVSWVACLYWWQTAVIASTQTPRSCRSDCLSHLHSETAWLLISYVGVAKGSLCCCLTISYNICWPPSHWHRHTFQLPSGLLEINFQK